MPARLLMSSPVRCPTLATPVEAKLSLPGLALASAMSSFRLLACTDGCAVSTFGEEAGWVMGVKSFTGSYGIFAWRLGAIARLAM
ncbi:hypothetical protein D3C83_102140 [compost metagenome]